MVSIDNEWVLLLITLPISPTSGVHPQIMIWCTNLAVCCQWHRRKTGMMIYSMVPQLAWFYLPPSTYFYLHIIIYHSSVNLLNCNYFATMAYLLPYHLTPFAHAIYRLYFFSIVLLTVCLFIPCVTLSYCFALSWPGRSCKWELVLNWPTWLNKGDIKN